MTAKRRLFEGVAVLTVLYGVQTWNMREADRRRLDVFEMRCLRGMLAVSRTDGVRNEDVRRKTQVERREERRVKGKKESEGKEGE